MAISMDIETIESFLQSLHLDKLITTFKENDVDFDLLISLSETELMGLLTDIKLTPGNRYKIAHKIRTIKASDTKCQTETKGSFEYPDIASLELEDRMEAKAVLGSPQCVVGKKNTTGHIETKGAFGSPLSNIATKDSGDLELERTDCANDEIRIVLVGKTGSGKSATGNTILRNNSFKSFLSSISVTKYCFLNSVVRFGKTILVVDTPGLFDTDVSNEETQKEITKCIGITSPGPHAFIIVLNLGRFTREEKKTVDHFVKYFGETVYQYFIVLFTRKDELDDHNINFKDHLSKVSEPLKMFIEKCGGRAIAFNNKLKGDQSDQQVKELLEMIEKNVERNKGKFYTNKAYIEAEREVQKMEKELLKRVQKEADKKLKALKESEETTDEYTERLTAMAIYSDLKEKEDNVRNYVRKNIEVNGFVQAWKYIKSWWPF